MSGKLRKEVLRFMLVSVEEVYVSFSNVVRPCVLGGCVKMWCRYCRVVCFRMKRVLMFCMWSSSGVRFRYVCVELGVSVIPRVYIFAVG